VYSGRHRSLSVVIALFSTWILVLVLANAATDAAPPAISFFSFHIRFSHMDFVPEPLRSQNTPTDIAFSSTG
jgi:hypothetical protein